MIIGAILVDYRISCLLENLIFKFPKFARFVGTVADRAGRRAYHSLNAHSSYGTLWLCRHRSAPSPSPIAA